MDKLICIGQCLVWLVVGLRGTSSIVFLCISTGFAYQPRIQWLFWRRRDLKGYLDVGCTFEMFHVEIDCCLDEFLHLSNFKWVKLHDKVFVEFCEDFIRVIA